MVRGFSSWQLNQPVVDVRELLHSLSMSRTSLLCLAALGCGGGSSGSLAPTDPNALMATLDRPRRVRQQARRHRRGPAGRRVHRGAVHRRSASTTCTSRRSRSRSWDLTSATMTDHDRRRRLDAAASTCSRRRARARADADIVDVDTATDAELAASTSPARSRSSSATRASTASAQYKNVTAKGAIGDAVPVDRAAEPAPGRLGAVRLGVDRARSRRSRSAPTTARRSRPRSTAARPCTRTSTCQVTSTPGTGANVVGRIAGERPETIVLGAHYDTWFTGSTDNGGGVAELLDDRRAPRAARQAEVHAGVRRVRRRGDRPVRRLRLPAQARRSSARIRSSRCSTSRARRRTTPTSPGSCTRTSRRSTTRCRTAHLRQHLRRLRRASRSSRSCSAASSRPTSRALSQRRPDGDDRRDEPLLPHDRGHARQGRSRSCSRVRPTSFDAALDFMLQDEPADFAVADPQLWTARASRRPRAPRSRSTRRSTTAPARRSANAIASRPSMLSTTSSLATRVTATTDANGHAHARCSRPTRRRWAQGNRFLHVTAGPTYPLVEKIISLP